jgi:hypothetical protein
MAEVIEVDKAAVAVAFAEAGPLLGEDVGVEIDFVHRCKHLRSKKM